MDAGQTWMVGDRVEVENNSGKRKDREAGRALRESPVSGRDHGASAEGSLHRLTFIEDPVDREAKHGLLKGKCLGAQHHPNLPPT